MTVPKKSGFTPLEKLPAPIVENLPDRVLEPFEAKHPGGRPTKYKPEYCERVIEAGREGYSLTAFAAMIEVDRDTITEWCSVHPEFSLAVKHHKAHRARMWEDRLAKVADRGGAPGQATAIIFGLKNVAPEEWRDRTEITGAEGAPLQIAITLEDARRRAAIDVAFEPVKDAPASLADGLKATRERT